MSWGNLPTTQDRKSDGKRPGEGDILVRFMAYLPELWGIVEVILFLSLFEVKTLEIDRTELGTNSLTCAVSLQHTSYFNSLGPFLSPSTPKGKQLMYFTSVWRRAAASEGGDLDFKKISENMLQEDFCENFYGLWWLFSCIYGGLGGENNTEMGTKICICLWAGSTAIFTRGERFGDFFCLWTASSCGLFSYRWKGQIPSQCWQGPSFIPVKLRNGNKEPVVLGTLGAENRRRRSQAALSLGPLTFEPEQWHTPGFTERQAFRGFAVLDL